MFVPILAVSEALCSGVVVCLLFSAPLILQYVPYVLAILFLIAAAVSWWKVRWSRITLIFIALTILSAATLIPHFWSLYQQKNTIEQNAKNKKAQNEAMVKNASFQLLQPALNSAKLNLVAFHPTKTNMQVESGGSTQRILFYAVYENKDKQQLLITYTTAKESPEKSGWGCDAAGKPLQQSRQAATCQKQSILSDKAVVYRQDYEESSQKYIYSTIRNDVLFVTGATTMKPEDVSSAFDGFTPTDRDKITLIDSK